MAAWGPAIVCDGRTASTNENTFAVSIRRQVGGGEFGQVLPCLSHGAMARATGVRVTSSASEGFAVPLVKGTTPVHVLAPMTRRAA